MGNTLANAYVEVRSFSNTSIVAIEDAQGRGWKESSYLTGRAENGTIVGFMPMPCESHRATGSTTF